MLTPGFYPFWFWNDYLTVEEIKWQIKEMADKGIKGFYIHPRQGLKQPYLSESFFEMVDIALQEAERYGLAVNLYDEYPYPSGIAGGEVVLGKPEYYATELIQKSDLVKGGHIRIEYPSGKILSARAYPYLNGQVNWEKEIALEKHIGIVLSEESYVETGLTNYNRKRFFASKPIPVLDVFLPEGEYKIFVSIQAEVKKHKYWDNYVDVLNKNAIKKFINSTHERYRERYNDKFNTSIVSIFTDEIHPIWSDKIIEFFRREYDYDLIDYLPALQDSTHPEHVKVSYDLNQLKYKMFCTSYEKQVADWCKNNNLLYAGEKPALRLSQLKYMDIPGCDAGHEKAGSMAPLVNPNIRSNARATASAAYFYGKEHSLCECYHSIGWSATLQDAKLIAEKLLALGIDILVPHAFFYTTHGLRKHDAPPSFFFQMPFWPFFKELSKRIEYIGEQFNDTYLDAEILVIDPASGVPSDSNLRIYEDILSLLFQTHLEFLIVDTDILKSGTIEDGFLKIKDLMIKLIIVPPMQKIEKPLARWLEEYESAGGRVLYCKENQDLSEIKGRIINFVKPGLSIKEDGHEIEDLLISKRKNKDKTIWFVVNTSDKKYEATILTEKKYEIKELLTEEVYSSPIKKENGIYQRTIYPFESFILSTDNENESDFKDNTIPEIIVDVSDRAYIEVKNKNLLRMNLWDMSLLDTNGNIVNLATVEAMPLSNQLDRAGLSFKPKFRNYFGHRPELDFPNLSIIYEYKFENNFSGMVELLMEPGTIRGNWSIVINNQKEFFVEDFYDTEDFIKGSLAVEITKFLHQGVNRVEVKVEVSRPSDGLVNPLYLIGNFGVMLDPISITDQKRTGLFEEYEKNLLPFYSGVIEYKTEFMLDSIPESSSVLIRPRYGRKFQQATEISINNSKFKPVLWEPRCFKLSTNVLKKGKNIMTTRVYTTLIRSFEGKKFDYEDHCYRKIGD